MVRAHLQLVNSGITPWMEKLTNCSSCISKDRICLEFFNINVHNIQGALFLNVLISIVSFKLPLYL